VLYEAADEIRLEALKSGGDQEVAGLAAKMDREEAYHRIHAQMWEERLRNEPRFQAALDELWPAAVAVLPEDLRPRLAERMGREIPPDLGDYERGTHSEEWPALWEEMTEVRRSVPGAEW
jgi:1,2-phenylacetyl-CoA epoxidase catalytic subunit